MAVNKEEKVLIIEKYGGSKANTGLPEVQVALLTATIASITEHMKVNKKDNSCKRGLLRQVSKRRSLLNYIKKNDVLRYRKLIEKLGLRN